MGTLKRRSRHRIEDRDQITLAWDKGLPPPPEASQPDKHDDLVGVIFFRSAELETYGQDHPNLREWLEVLRLGRPEG